MTGKKKAQVKAVEPALDAPEPILIVDADSFTPVPALDTFCKKCNVSVAVYGVIDSSTSKGYCSVDCYIAR